MQSFLAICESDPGTQRLMEVYSSRLGFQAFIRDDCMELLQAMSAESVIPGMIFFQSRHSFMEAAMDCLKNTSSYQNYRNLPIVVITTNPKEEHYLELLKLGACAVLVKPFRLEDMSRIVKEHCIEHQGDLRIE